MHLSPAKVTCTLHSAYTTNHTVYNVVGRGSLAVDSGYTMGDRCYYVVDWVISRLMGVIS